jgi:hypothetical protein
MKFASGCTHDEDDTQTANELMANIFDESVYAEEFGLYSAWTVSYRAASARQTATLAHIRQQRPRCNSSGTG